MVAHPLRCLVQRADAARSWRCRCGPGPPRGGGPRVPGRGGRLVPDHRLRGREGPGGGDLRRSLHLPGARHRLSPRQVRPGFRPGHQHLGRRPPRLHPPDEGVARGARPRSRSPRDRHHPDGQPGPGRRTGPDVDAGRRVRHLPRGDRRGGRRCGPLLPGGLQPRHSDHVRSRRGQAAEHGQPRLLPAVRPRPDAEPRGLRRRIRGGSGAPRRRRSLAAGPSRPRSRCSSSATVCARRSREAAQRRAPHRITAYGYELATAFHRFYTECRIVTEDAGTHPGPAVAGRGGQERDAGDARLAGHHRSQRM